MTQYVRLNDGFIYKTKDRLNRGRVCFFEQNSIEENNRIFGVSKCSYSSLRRQFPDISNYLYDYLNYYNLLDEYRKGDLNYGSWMSTLKVLDRSINREIHNDYDFKVKELKFHKGYQEWILKMVTFEKCDHKLYEENLSLLLELVDEYNCTDEKYLEIYEGKCKAFIRKHQNCCKLSTN